MKILNALLSLPKSLYICFLNLPLREALKIPIFVHYNSKISIKGKLCIKGSASFAQIRIGFHKVPVKHSSETTIFNVKKNGFVYFEGKTHIGKGSIINVERGANLILGDNFAISASSVISCYKQIEFGKNVQLSWDDLIMDSDTHIIYSEDGSILNEIKPIVFDDKIWVGCRCTVLKGTHVPHDCVIGACSLVSGDKFEPNTIIAGSPAKSIKKIKTFKI
ncbi:acyltransferase [Xylanibacter oryzae]|uniref:acyltransferase n=1 Tax=Xylanibacter oryzae TaxID=185293 RepID=UPI0004BC50E2|nr:acyltransferase [Xylanibacter oryzae]